MKSRFVKCSDDKAHLGMVRIFAVAILFSAATSLNVFAQEDWEKDPAGEIKDVEIEIIKDRKITLPRATRNFEKVPPRPYEPIKPAITYELNNYKFATPDYKPQLRPLKLKQEELSKIYGNYLSVGFGNYASFFVEGSVTTKRDKNKFLGAHLYSKSFGQGPVDEKNSGASSTKVEVFGKTMTKDVTLSGNASYENTAGYFYGYDPVVEVDRDRIRQTYSRYAVGLGLANTRTGDFSYQINGGYNYLQDHFHAREGIIALDFSSRYVISEGQNFSINADYFLIDRTDSLITSQPRHLLRIKPSYQFTPIENLVLTAGINMALQNDQYAGSKDLLFYPHLKAEFALSPSVEIYGLLTGDIDKVDLHTLSAENFWVNSNIPILHTNRAIDFQGGIKGKLGSQVAFHAGLSFASLKNYYFYQTTRDNFNPAAKDIGVPVDKFNVVYDNNTIRTNTFGEVSYAHAEIFRLSLRGELYSYTTDALAEAWHRPTYRFALNARYNLYDKISLEAGLIGLGGMKSFDPGSLGIVTLDPALDLNMKLRYFLSKQFSAFAQFNNMLSTNYPIYQSYPARGFQVMAGVSWSF